MFKKKVINYDEYQSSSSACFTTSLTVGGYNQIAHEDIIWTEETFVESGKYSVMAIANWLLNKESMTHKKLQKLCYYVQAWNYTLNHTKLIDTCFEAWVHGPVSPVLYEQFKSFGYNTIKMTGEYVTQIDAADEEILENVWATYGGHTGNALEALTHTEDPWIIARKGYAPMEKCQVMIELEDMKQYYGSIYNR